MIAVDQVDCKITVTLLSTSNHLLSDHVYVNRGSTIWWHPPILPWHKLRMF